MIFYHFFFCFKSQLPLFFAERNHVFFTLKAEFDYLHLEE